MSAWDWFALAGVGAALMVIRGYMFKQWTNAGPADRAGLALVPLGFVAGLALAFYIGNGVPIQTAFTVALLGLCAGGYVAAGGSLLLWLLRKRR